MGRLEYRHPMWVSKYSENNLVTICNAPIEDIICLETHDLDNPSRIEMEFGESYDAVHPLYLKQYEETKGMNRAQRRQWVKENKRR